MRVAKQLGAYVAVALTCALGACSESSTTGDNGAVPMNGGDNNAGNNGDNNNAGNNGNDNAGNNGNGGNDGNNGNPNVTPDPCPDAAECGGRECGPDPVCGASCGSCRTGACSPQGRCVVDDDCSTDCAALRYSACSCGSDDPCRWREDNDCDEECSELFPNDFFDDSVDCRGCEHRCPTEGATECFRGGIKRCETARDGCLDWTDSVWCESRMCADETSCLPPPEIPGTWTCENEQYADGNLCHCECGAIDPDCADPDAGLRGCEAAQFCNDDGACEYVERVSECMPPDPPPDPAPQVTPPELELRTGVNSRHANADATYLESRDVEALNQADALSELQQNIVARLARIGGGSFGVDALVFGEADDRWGTFLPEEQAEFPALWSLLEVVDPDVLAPHDRLVPLAELTETHRNMAPIHLDVDARFPIAELPMEMQDAARRILKTPGADANTLAFSEVVTALQDFRLYASSEYFRFPTLLRAIERQALTPERYPHIDIGSGVAETKEVAVGDARVLVERRIRRQTCDVFASGGTSLWTEVHVTFDIPQGATLTWTPLARTSVLRRRDSSFNREVFYLTAPSTQRYRVDATDWAVALVELWQGGERVAQNSVHLAGDHTVGGEGLAIVRDGEFECAPWDGHPDHTDSLSNAWRIPPGVYEFPVGSYGTARMEYFGLGLFSFVLLESRHWAYQEPTPTRSKDELCLEFTSLGPSNMVTCGSGPGPGILLEYESGEVLFSETSYGICHDGGRQVATLTADSRIRE